VPGGEAFRGKTLSSEDHISASVSVLGAELGCRVPPSSERHAQMPFCQLATAASNSSQRPYSCLLATPSYFATASGRAPTAPKGCLGKKTSRSSEDEEPIRLPLHADPPPTKARATRLSQAAA